jgi:small subunit ribosomal protein S16
MATKIRLRRTGTTNLALYRIVVADARAPRDGRFIENLGHYDPRKEGKEKVVVNLERLKYWLSVGAQMTDSVIPLVKAQGVEIPVKRKRKSTPKKVQVTQTKTNEVKAETTDAPPAEETPAATE